MLNKLIFFSIITVIFYYKIINAASLENSEIDEKCTSICSSKECLKKAKNLIANMDKNINPCDDFYQFACGNFLKNRVIPEDKVSASQFGVAQSRLDKQLTKELKNEILPTDFGYVKKLKMYYRDCLNKDEIEKVDAEPLLNLLNRLGGWPVLLGDDWNEKDYTWEKLTSNISKEGFTPDLPIDIYVGLDSTNSQNFSLHIDSVYTVINDINNDKLIEAYESYAVEIAILLGANRERAEKEMKDVVEFHKSLFKAQLRREELDDVSRLENRKKISDLNKEYPDLPWLDVINRILSPNNVSITENDIVEIHDPKFMSEIGLLMKNTPKRVLANYQIIKVIEDVISVMSDKFMNLRLTFLRKTIGLKKFPKREKFCSYKVRGYFYIAISSLYVKNHFDHESRVKVIEMINNIRNETKASLEKMDWMDDYTREGALKKLEAMKTLAGYPDELFDDQKIENFYNNVEITPGKFFDNYQNIVACATNFHFSKLGKPVREFEWTSNSVVAMVNAFYNFGKNQISIIAGILQNPFFNSQWPNYLNYGGIGYVIGHEITHGFDYTGRKYDYEGNFKNWWDNKTADEFQRRVQCNIDQYSNYSIKQIDKKINGKLTKGENIADAGGIKLAYHAYERSVKNKGIVDDCLPNLNYTSVQMFWISAATIWCEKLTDGILKKANVDDVHSPGEARVNVVFSNTDEFAKDFKCPVGSAMNPTKQCSVW